MTAEWIKKWSHTAFTKVKSKWIQNHLATLSYLNNQQKANDHKDSQPNKTHMHSLIFIEHKDITKKHLNYSFIHPNNMKGDNLWLSWLHALYVTSLCKYSISSAFGCRVPLGIVSNLLEILASATDTGT